MNHEDDDLLSVAEAATRLSVSQLTVRRWIAAGTLPAVRYGSRIIRVRRADLDALARPVRGETS